MNKKIFFLVVLIFLLVAARLFSPAFERRMVNQVELAQHSTDLKLRTDVNSLIRAGDLYLSKAQFSLAEAQYLQALSSSQGMALEGVVRSALMRLYEKAEEFDKAMTQLDWLLEHMSKEVPQYQTYLVLKSRYAEHSNRNRTA